MRSIFLSASAEADFRRFVGTHRNRTLHLLRTIQNDPASVHPIRVRSDVLGTSLFMIRSGKLRLLYEIDDDRIIVLALRETTPGPKNPQAKHSHPRH